MIAPILSSKLKASQSMFLGGPLLNAKLLERLLLESLGHDFLSVKQHRTVGCRSMNPGFNRLPEPWSRLTQRDLARKLLQDEAIVNLKFAHSFQPRKQVQVLADRPVLRQQISAAVLTLEGPG